MRDVEFLPAWYPRQRRIRVALVTTSVTALVTSLAVIVLLFAR